MALPSEQLWHASIKADALFDDKDKHGITILVERFEARSSSLAFVC